MKGKNLGSVATEASPSPLKSTIPKASESTYPTINPTSTDSERAIPFAKTIVSMQASKVTEPTIQLFTLPKSGAPCPPAKLFAPTGNSENPIAVTTVAATTCGMSFVHLFGKSPRHHSTTPPTMTAPTSAPIP